MHTVSWEPPGVDGFEPRPADGGSDEADASGSADFPV
jgi:hypothetical protein